MENLRLIKILSTLSQEEWKEFIKFVNSPYFNKGRNYSSLMKELKKFHPGFDSPKLTKEYLYKKIYKGKIYKETVMNTIISGLYSLAIDFLVQIDHMHKEFEKNIGLLYQLSSRNLTHIHNTEFQKIEKKISENKLRI